MTPPARTDSGDALRVEIHATAAHRERYRSLLTEDWSVDALDRAVALLFEILDPTGIQFDAPASWVVQKSATTSVRVSLDDSHGLLQTVAHLKGYRVDDAMLSLTDATDHSDVQRSLKVRLCLSFPLLFPQLTIQLMGDTGLVRDLQSLILQCALFDLLPGMPGSTVSADSPLGSSEHLALLLTISGHISTVWQDEPAHLAHLEVLVLDYLGDEQRSGKLKQLAFRQTPRNAHEYLTKAQIYWSHLMDARQYHEAEGFILALYRDAPAEQLDEIRELLAETEQMYAQRR